MKVFAHKEQRFQSSEGFLDRLAQRFPVGSSGGFFGRDFHHGSHLRFGGRTCLRNRFFDKLNDLTFG
jgi:hypothetical protein